MTAHNLVIGFLTRSLDKKDLLSFYRDIPKDANQLVAPDIDGCGHWNLTDENGIRVMEVNYKGAM